MAYYRIGSSTDIDRDPYYATLAEAAEAIRIKNGWSEVHLADPVGETEVWIPTYYAYQTQEERDAANVWHIPAPWIWEMRELGDP